MDQGDGRFKMLDEARLSDLYASFSTQEEKLQAQKRLFSVGEEVQIKDSRFRITRITPKKLILKLLPNQERSGTERSG